MTAFPELQFGMYEAAFGHWVNSGDSNELFYNRLELVLWLLIERDKILQQQG